MYVSQGEIIKPWFIVICIEAWVIHTAIQVAMFYTQECFKEHTYRNVARPSFAILRRVTFEEMVNVFQ